MEAQQNGKTAGVVTLWLAAAVSIATLAGTGYSYVHDTELRFAAVETTANSAKLHGDEHERTAREWKDRIVDIEQRLRELSTNALSRPDPFTGTQGDILERRIDKLERLAEVVKFMRKRIDDMAAELRESQLYYRRQIVPMLEQSNTLQQQQIMQSME